MKEEAACGKVWWWVMGEEGRREREISLQAACNWSKGNVLGPSVSVSILPVAVVHSVLIDIQQVESIADAFFLLLGVVPGGGLLVTLAAPCVRPVALLRVSRCLCCTCSCSSAGGRYVTNRLLAVGCLQVRKAKVRRSVGIFVVPLPIYLLNTRRTICLVCISKLSIVSIDKTHSCPSNYR